MMTIGRRRRRAFASDRFTSPFSSRIVPAAPTREDSQRPLVSSRYRGRCAEWRRVPPRSARHGCGTTDRRDDHQNRMGSHALRPGQRLLDRDHLDRRAERMLEGLAVWIGGLLQPPQRLVADGRAGGDPQAGRIVGSQQLVGDGPQGVRGQQGLAAAGRQPQANVGDILEAGRGKVVAAGDVLEGVALKTVDAPVVALAGGGAIVAQPLQRLFLIFFQWQPHGKIPPRRASTVQNLPRRTSPCKSRPKGAQPDSPGQRPGKPDRSIYSQVNDRYPPNSAPKGATRQPRATPWETGPFHYLDKVQRTVTLSIPHVTLVVFDPVAFQHQSELLLKRPLPVVFLLIGDVRFHLFDVGRADGKRPIPVLPVEIRPAPALPP